MRHFFIFWGWIHPQNSQQEPLPSPHCISKAIMAELKSDLSDFSREIGCFYLNKHVIGEDKSLFFWPPVICFTLPLDDPSIWFLGDSNEFQLVFWQKPLHLLESDHPSFIFAHVYALWVYQNILIHVLQNVHEHVVVRGCLLCMRENVCRCMYVCMSMRIYMCVVYWYVCVLFSYYACILYVTRINIYIYIYIYIYTHMKSYMHTIHANKRVKIHTFCIRANNLNHNTCN